MIRNKQLKFYHLREFINEWYWNDAMSSTKIAEMCNCDPVTIRNSLRKNSIRIRSRAGENHVKIDGILNEILNGELLGDGCLDLGKEAKGAIYRHTNKYIDYLKWLFTKLAILGLKGNGKIYINSHGQSYQANTYRYRELTDLREKWYPHGVKAIPEDTSLTPITVLHWFLGDGSLIKRRDRNLYRLYLATDGFTYDDVYKLNSEIRDMGINSYAQHIANGQYRLSIYEQKAIKMFFNYTGPCPKEIKNIYGYKFLNTI